jgi:hypothetical protein
VIACATQASEVGDRKNFIVGRDDVEAAETKRTTILLHQDLTAMHTKNHTAPPIRLLAWPAMEQVLNESVTENFVQR